ncbi:type 2 isopentenyl-diphosphate Delta-isomerase [Zhaonella formicivorans]|uniref:type 2 isopentenyl-diphosphate Delta-isomerase n=1 Tax=Zhaonella formicivorans TaxID=2528593 RepID=UPI0010F3EB37|nr:type 2 isopentenyl-diphosphate Delta-isomerase [Zhaonella formicivorans]
MGTKRHSLRESRKLDHINLALHLPEGPMSNGFEDIHLVHQALPELNYGEIDLRCCWLNKKLEAPLLINAITGGAEDTTAINASLARVARRFGLGMAVGSQTAALKNFQMEKTYRVARQENPEGLLLANISATARWSDALRAVEMIEADGLQLHLNVLQELLMPEGDRCFKGVLDNIGEIVSRSPVPVIVKEVGFGFSKEAALKLYEQGVQNLDVGGKGGTNFAAIENSRTKLNARDTFVEWGLSTASSLLEVSSLNLPVQLIASGGIRTGVEVVKALRLGATLAGIAGSFLKTLLTKSESDLASLVETLISEIKITMLLTGAGNLQVLHAVPVVITGATLEWAKQRKINIIY